MHPRLLLPALLAPIMLAVAIAACSPSPDHSASEIDSDSSAAAPDVPDAPLVAGASDPAPDPSAQPEEAMGGGRAVKIHNDLYYFDYDYPDAAGNIPALKEMLDADITVQQGRLRRESQADQDEAKKDGYPYRAHSLGMSWSVVTDLPQWLSLSGKGYTFSGGAHGNTWFGEILWDKQANKERKPIDLFTSKAALLQAIQDPFCAALNKQRARKRGIPVAQVGASSTSGSIPEFDSCIDPTKETIILGSSNGQTFDRVGILIPPYDAGAYAEGTYEVTLPVTPAILAALRPQYRASFAPAS